MSSPAQSSQVSNSTFGTPTKEPDADLLTHMLTLEQHTKISGSGENGDTTLSEVEVRKQAFKSIAAILQQERRFTSLCSPGFVSRLSSCVLFELKTQMPVADTVSQKKHQKLYTSSVYHGLCILMTLLYWCVQGRTKLTGHLTTSRDESHNH